MKMLGTGPRHHSHIARLPQVFQHIWDRHGEPKIDPLLAEVLDVVVVVLLEVPVEAEGAEMGEVDMEQAENPLVTQRIHQRQPD